ncbi:FprA family A-type flavoprotein [Methanobacterium ferruginis]|uniref:FprA family A-type flavoprotein n=1 Tax=Methanobacterium ferruginis TaxID=710191 RepID=UPI002573E7DD|nr:FprA family A-type flavoprotein [Methanobacterium ferruginis]BDZ69164.1 MBL fold metallo-hydrolase [Methanobacterium ferruginis]
MKADAVKIGEGVYWIGVMDWDIRSYHGYTLKGTTYNAYLVFGEDEVVIIDNTYPGSSAQLWGRVEDAFRKEGREIKLDVIIQNHVERDHSGSLSEIHKRFPDAPIYCSQVAINGLKQHYPVLEGADFHPVKTGDTLEVGGRTLAFLDAKMLHWPDSMFTLLLDEGILFSNDAFGQHLCLRERYDHEIPEYLLMNAAQKFYANLITPASMLVLRKFDEVKKLELLDKIKMIAPAHGQIWTDPMKIINAYTNWATGQCKDKATIIYDTMHYSTRMMAHALAEGIMSGGVDVEMYFIHEDERSEMVNDILESKALLIGIPTLFNGPYPSVGDLLYYLEGLSFQRTGIKRLATTFGSKGWSGKGAVKVAETLKKCGFDVLDTFEVNYMPTKDEMDKCYQIGQEMAQKIKKM